MRVIFDPSSGVGELCQYVIEKEDCEFILK